MDATPAQQAGCEQARYLVCQESLYADASQLAKSRLRNAEEKGRPAILVRALSGSGAYTLYEAGRRHHFSTDWSRLSSEPSSYRPVIAALRYRRMDDVVAMTTVAARRLRKARAAGGRQ